MGYWAFVVDQEDWLHGDITVDLPPGDRVLLLGPGPVLLGAALVVSGGAIRVDRTPENPVPVDVDLSPGGHPLDPAVYRGLAGRLPDPTRTSEWLVSVAIPIEAGSPGDAVRQFWGYVRDLGPQELPAYVSPRDDELSMQAFVLGVPTNQDPEED